MTELDPEPYRYVWDYPNRSTHKSAWTLFDPRPEYEQDESKYR